MVAPVAGLALAEVAVLARVAQRLVLGVGLVPLLQLAEARGRDCGCGLGLCAFRACRRKAPRATPIIVGLPVVAEEGPVASPKGAKGRVTVLSPKGARVGVIEYAPEK